MNNIIRIGEFNHEKVRDSHPIIESNSALPKTFVPTLFPPSGVLHVPDSLYLVDQIWKKKKTCSCSFVLAFNP